MIQPSLLFKITSKDKARNGIRTPHGGGEVLERVSHWEVEDEVENVRLQQLYISIERR